MKIAYWLSMAAVTFALAAPARAGESDESAEAVEVNKLTTGVMKKLVDSGEAVTLIDARTAKWDDGKRIADAVSVPDDAGDDQIVAALPNKDARIVTYCSNLSCKASENLAKRLVGLGYKNVEKYPEGIEGWTDSGHPVTE